MGNWLRRFLPTVDGICLQPPRWRVVGKARDHTAFFRNLPRLLPTDAVLAIEGGRHPKELQAFITDHEVPAAAKVTPGTLWPRRVTHHLPATAAFLEELADRTEHCAAPEVCEHLHVYRNGEVLLEWFDAFFDPFYVSKRVPKEQLEQFCSRLGLTYVEEKAPPAP